MNKTLKIIIVVSLSTSLMFGILLAVSLFNRSSESQDIDQRLGITAKEISSKELTGHNRIDDCWVIVGGNVYDASKLKLEQSEKDILAKYCGQEASEFFVYKPSGQAIFSKQKTYTLFEELKLNKIGIIAPN